MNLKIININLPPNSASKYVFRLGKHLLAWLCFGIILVMGFSLQLRRQAQADLWSNIARNNGNALQRDLNHGADVNATNKLGQTPLMYAASEGLSTTVSLLIEHGADVNATDAHGDTALIYAVNADHLNSVQVLLANHADRNHKDRGGFTALDFARTASARCVALLK